MDKTEEEKIEELIERHRLDDGSVVGLLQEIQQIYRYLPEEVLRTVSDRLDLSLTNLYGLATFYSTFRLDPVGKHHVCVCMGTACHVNGAPKVVEALERELAIDAGETTEDGNFTLETVNCLGACALGPLVVVDGEYHGKINQKGVPKLVKKYRDSEVESE